MRSLLHLNYHRIFQVIPDMTVFRVGDGTVPLAIVIYIDGSFIKHSIPVKPIYITVRNLDSVVSGKAMACRVLSPRNAAQLQEKRNTQRV